MSDSPPLQSSQPSPPSQSSIHPSTTPIIFTNLLRFHAESQYPSSLPTSLNPYLDTIPPSTTGSDAYWNRYFPVYHQVTRDVLGEDADKLQRVLYKGAPLTVLKGSRGRSRGTERGNGSGKQVSSSSSSSSSSEVEGRVATDGDVTGSINDNSTKSEGQEQDQDQPQDQPYWHAVVMTRVTSWDLVQKISENERYKILGTFHREAAVEDDELYVSEPVEGFEMGV